jgi:hypothetical protein
MSRLALVWDGTWLTWTTFTDTGVGRREISRPDMVPEVLRALRNQVGAGAQVVHAEWGKPSTVVPQTLLPDAGKEEVMEQCHELHHGPLAPGECLNLTSLDEWHDGPMLAVSGSQVWADALHRVFPQARHIPLVQVLLHDAITWNRSEPHSGWTFRADVRAEGAIVVATEGETLQWVHHLPPGIVSDDALYAMVNAAHRAGADIHQARVRWSGDPEWTRGWDRFLAVHAAPNPEESETLPSWLPVLQSMLACG